MRAKFLSDLKVEKNYILKGDDHHHLAHVVRIEVGEKLLLLNGQGLQVETLVENISKKDIQLQYLASSEKNLSFSLDLILGMPKRDALELSLKQAVEIGFKKIVLVRSKYSQMKSIESDRLHNLLVSALEQSNAPFLPEVVYQDWSEIEWSDYSSIALMDSQTKDRLDSMPQNKSSAFGLVVGPEGGFSSEELEFLHSQPNLKVICLPTPIMRTPTAVAVGAGVLLQTLLD